MTRLNPSNLSSSSRLSLLQASPTQECPCQRKLKTTQPRAAPLPTKHIPSHPPHPIAKPSQPQAESALQNPHLNSTRPTSHNPQKKSGKDALLSARQQSLYVIFRYVISAAPFSSHVPNSPCPRSTHASSLPNMPSIPLTQPSPPKSPNRISPQTPPNQRNSPPKTASSRSGSSRSKDSASPSVSQAQDSNSSQAHGNTRS